MENGERWSFHRDIWVLVSDSFEFGYVTQGDEDQNPIVDSLKAQVLKVS